MEQKIINKAKKILANADTGTNDCKNYNNGFMDGVKYAIKALRQLPVSGSLLFSQKDIEKKLDALGLNGKYIASHFKSNDR